MPLTPVTWLDDFVVNLTIDGVQNAPRIVHLANGNIVVVWSSQNDKGVGDPALSDVIGQIFSPTGERIGGEFIVNGVTDFFESTPDIAALPGGGFLTAYTVANAGTSSIVVTQRDANGGSATSTNITNDVTASDDPTFFEPRIAVQSATSALVIYRVTEADGDSDIRGVIYNSETQSIGSELNLLTLEGVNGQAEVIALGNSQYVVVGQKVAIDGDTTIVYAIFNDDGSTHVGETTIFETALPDSIDSQPSVAALAGGGFVVSWTKTDPVDTDVVVQIYDSNGFPVDGNLNVNGDGGSDNNTGSAVVAMFDGGFVVFYVNDVTDQIEGQRYDALGIEVGDVYVVSTDAGANSIDAERLDDGRIVLSFRDGAGESRLEIIDARDETNAPAYAPDSWQIGTPGDDIIDREFFAADNIAGGAGNDTLSVLTPAASYFGGAGDDTFIVQSALTLSDLLDGGTGTDSLDLADRTEDYTIDLSQDRLFLSGFASIELISFENVIGTSGNNGLVGTNGANVLDGFEGNDTIFGEGGADTLIGGNGFDQLFGGSGNDELGTITRATGLDDLSGGTGRDRVTFAFAASVNLEIDLARREYSTDGFESSSLIASIELLTTGESSDRITGNSAANVISTGAGDDIVFGGGGDDNLAGDSGNNTLSGGEGDDVLSGTTGTSRLSGDSGNDTLFGSTGNDALFGGTGADQIEGFGGVDRLFGGAGDDILIGGAGRDSLFGGSGRDNMTTGGDGGTYDAGADNDTMTVTSLGRQTLIGGSGADLLDMTELTAAITMDIDLGTFNVTGRLSGFETISLGSGADIVSGSQVEDTILGGDGRDSLAGLGGDDVLRGQGGNDTVLGFSGADALFGGADDDRIFGGSGNDTLQGGSGNDRLTDSTGNDTLSGEDGNDILQGGDGTDVLFGGLGNDRLFASIGGTGMFGGDGIDTADFSLLLENTTINLRTGLGSHGRNTGIENVVMGSGDDTVAGSAAANILRGNAGADVLNGGGGIDRLFGGAGDDRLLGGADADIMSGGAGNDRLSGGLGNDRMEGGTGIDILTGGAGRDSLSGGLGADRLSGGRGTDSFVFDTRLGPANVDRITDFNVAGETIRLENSGIFTGLVGGTLDATAFARNNSGNAADASDRIIYETDTGRLFFDRDGAGGAAKVHFATLSTNLAVNNADFFVF